jgi:GH15 family glucan-1,4-alpha-glucosidase
VRVGNEAAEQLQLDVFGEILDCAYLYSVHGGDISDELWAGLRSIVNLAVDRWQEPDASVWEVRGENLNFTYSKAMCWVAVDRGIKLARRLGKKPDARWGPAHTAIHETVMRLGYSAELGSFTQALGSDQVDASVLRLVQLGFLPDGDARLRRTIDAIDERLSSGPLVFRYAAATTDDGMSSPEGSFIICAFWLADALAIAGDLEEAMRRFERLLAFASPLGLFSEEVDSGTGMLLGNYPQAFSHLSLISAAVNIERRRKGTLRRARPSSETAPA